MTEPDAALVERLDDVVAKADETPAWVERHLADAIALVEQHPGHAQDPEVAARLAALTSMFDDVPQVVGLDNGARFTRATWAEGCLLLTVVFAEPDPDRRTMFRIVRAEPRVWYQTGIEGATNEITQQSVIVRLPCSDGDLEFVPGSY